MRTEILLVLLLVSQIKGDHDYAKVLEDSILFYEAQRSGDLPDDNRVPWRKDSCLNDGADLSLDLTGGWFDAGDYVKSSFSTAYAVTILCWGYMEYPEAYDDANQVDNLMDSIKWATDYLIKCHYTNHALVGLVGNPAADHGSWGRPEELTMARPSYYINETKPGSDLAAQVAAAFAAAAIVFETTDHEYAETCLTHARQLYDFAKKYKGSFADNMGESVYSSSDYNDELAWAAVWMYRATKNPIYLRTAEVLYQKYLYHQYSPAWSFDYSNKRVGTELLLYIVTGDDLYKTVVEAFITSYMCETCIDYTPDGLVYRSSWGPLRYAANAAFIALVADTNGIKAGVARPWAKSQIDWMLGDNDYDRSFVVGYGNNPAQRPHHRSSSCPSSGSCGWNEFSSSDPNPQTLTGALLGGPDQQVVDGVNVYPFVDDRTNYKTNEVAIDYNACFQGVVAGLI